MAVNAQLVSQYDGSDRAQLVSQYQEDGVAITLVTAIDGGNVDQSATTITDATTTTPLIEVEYRTAANTGTNGSGWRHTLFAVENASGKRPIFRLDRSTKSVATTPAADWLPQWTQDFDTWTQAPSRSLVGGTTGYIEFQFTDPLPAGRVYIADLPFGRQAEASALAAELLADYSSVASPVSSANASGVYNTTPAEVDENSRAIGQNAQYGIKLAFGGSTTDGNPKRKLVVTSGIHAAGEQTCWPAFEAMVRWILDDASSEAVAFRSNWDCYLYWNITPNGIKGGHRRHNFRSSVDPNRDFVNANLAEISALKSAIVADTGGAIDAFWDWHSYRSETNPFIVYFEHDDAVRSEFITQGTTVFGGAPSIYPGIGPSGSAGWAQGNLGAKLAVTAEVPQSGSSAVTFFRTIGQNWAKTLQAVDAEGVFATTITASGAVQGQAVGNVTLTQGYDLAVSGLSQGQGTGAATLTQAHELTPSPVEQGHTVGQPAITQGHEIAPASVEQVQAIGVTELTQAHLIVPASLGQAQAIAMTTLIQANVLAPDAVSHVQSLSSPSLTVAGDLVINALAHATRLGVVELVQANILTVDALEQGHALASVNVSQAGELLAAGLAQTQGLAASTLIQAHQVAVSDLAQAQTVEQVSLALADLLDIDDLFQGQAADQATLTQANILSVSDLTQTQLLQAVNFGGLVVGSLKGEIRIYALVDGALTIEPALKGNITIH